MVELHAPLGGIDAGDRAAALVHGAAAPARFPGASSRSSVPLQARLGIDQELARGDDPLALRSARRESRCGHRAPAPVFTVAARKRSPSMTITTLRVPVWMTASVGTVSALRAADTSVTSTNMPGRKRHARIGERDPRLDGARLRVQFRVDVVQAALEDPAGQSLHARLARAGRCAASPPAPRAPPR